jgi:hypothetical protein
MNVTLSFPVREVGGEKWLSLASMGIKRLDVVAYAFDVKKNHTFAGGHRHRFAVARDDIHLKFATEQHEIKLDISAVAPASTPPRRRHG